MSGSQAVPNPANGIVSGGVAADGDVTQETSLVDQQASHHDGNHPSTGEEKVGFKAQVEGYAKKFAGKTFGNAKEVAQGEARLKGEPEVDPGLDPTKQQQ
ncbi:hypothetical protein CROQUDRAFT_104239 [Cronartium quercuum f. sp. fusiforme G11]|uniref:Uncharacterized protein n=1 Tax=Cronartium quercuum f. sp. fusiforme G11 TaxID=708437 RepID=A0A9P6TGB0_9BASI|nr:hypothetical protein CROQUDRAFT_104239 [Cronartium quercuum f. sp. fusiforme G11]